MSEVVETLNLKSERKTEYSETGKARWYAIQSSIYECFSLILNSRDSLPTLKITSQKLLEVLSSFIIALQLISLNWKIHPEIDDFDSYKNYWKFLGYASFDNICADSDFLLGCYFGSLLLIFITAVLVSIIYSLKLMNKRVSSVLKFMARNCIKFVSIIGLIPIITIFTLTIKYSLNNGNQVYEYRYCNSCNLNRSPEEILASIVCLCIVILFSVTYQIFSAELRHTSKQENIKAKAHSLLDIEMVIFSLVSTFSFTYLNTYSTFYYKYVLLLFPIRLVWKFFYLIPYYNSIANEIYITKNAMIGTATAIFLFGIAISNAGAIFLLFLICIPITVALLLDRFKNVFSKLGKNNSIPQNQYEFELKFRNLLSEQKEIIMHDFKEVKSFYRFIHDKLIVIWETNYCLFILQDERLARIKLAKAKEMGFSMEGNFQEWLCLKSFQDAKVENNEDVNMIYYLLEIEEVKKDDELLCHYMMRFWREITTKGPKLSAVFSFSAKLTRTLDKVKKEYASLIARFPHSANLNELYGSLLQDLLGDYENGAKLLRKRESLRVVDSQHSQDKFVLFNEINGIMLVSAEKASFGAITYVNEKAAQILKQTALGIIGSKLSSYIPSPFDQNHDKHMENFIENCVNPEVGSSMAICLQTARGYLVECRLKIWLSSARRQLYYMVSIKQIHKSRQIALISASGMIFSHSEMFPHFIDNTSDTLKGKLLSDLIPNFDISLIELNVPKRFSINNKEILLVHSEYSINKTIVHFIFLIHEKHEIDEWAHKSQDYLYSEAKKELNSATLKVPNKKVPLSHSFSNEKKAIINTLDISVEETEIPKEITKSQLSASSASYSISSSLSNRMALRSENNLKIFKFTLLITILVAMAMNIIILCFILSQINHSNDLNAIKHLGVILFDSSKIGYLSRALEVGKNRKNFNYTYYKNLFNGAVVEVDNNRNFLFEDLPKWDYCSSSEIIKKSIIPIWNPNSIENMTYLNLYDAVSNMLSYAYPYSGLIENDLDHKDSEFYLIVNHLGQFYNYVNGSFSGFISCEKDRLASETMNINYLTIMGLCVLGICTLVLIPIAKRLQDNFNGLLNHVKKLAHSSYYELHQNCLNRLSTVHDFSQDNEDLKRPKFQDVEIKSREGYHLMLLCFVFILFSSGYYIIVTFWLYPSCTSLLDQRFDFMEFWYVRSASISEVAFWTRETSLRGNNTLEQLLNSHYNFQKPPNELFNAIKKFMITSKDVEDLDNRNMYSSYLIQFIFENQTNPKNIMWKYGSFPASNVIILDSYYQAFSNAAIPSDLALWYTRASILQNAIKNITDMADIASKTVIEERLNDIIYITAGYCVFCVLLYIFFYTPFVAFEKRKISRLQSITSLVPSGFFQKKDEVSHEFLKTS
ncbi:unnamed protein product [Blepharisma stoltei]|uniref:TmcB/TmcC TPR repeats domain-containing protein n=1 Tax=Blepharisma stoltei TaxID=1481888 RepID=A0AAU9IWQ8_9CILI|nr:unnamed protein product [Blepharisma stoltei]